MGKSFTLINESLFLTIEAPGGIYNATQLKRIAELVEDEASVVKVTEDQRLALFVPPSQEDLVVTELEAVGLGVRNYQDGLHQPTTCIGELCPFADQDALGSAMEISHNIMDLNLDSPLKIGINGCQRCCVPTHTLDIAIVGDSSGYRINLGGKNSQIPELANFIAEGVPTDELTNLIRSVLEKYNEVCEPEESLQETMERVGALPFINLLAPYSQDAQENVDPLTINHPEESRASEHREMPQGSEVEIGDLSNDQLETDSGAGLDNSTIEVDEGELLESEDFAGLPVDAAVVSTADGVMDAQMVNEVVDNFDVETEEDVGLVDLAETESKSLLGDDSLALLDQGELSDSSAAEEEWEQFKTVDSGDEEIDSAEQDAGFDEEELQASASELRPDHADLNKVENEDDFEQLQNEELTADTETEDRSVDLKAVSENSSPDSEGEEGDDLDSLNESLGLDSNDDSGFALLDEPDLAEMDIDPVKAQGTEYELESEVPIDGEATDPQAINDDLSAIDIDQLPAEEFDSKITPEGELEDSMAEFNMQAEEVSEGEAEDFEQRIAASIAEEMEVTRSQEEDQAQSEERMSAVMLVESRLDDGDDFEDGEEFAEDTELAFDVSNIEAEMDGILPEEYTGVSSGSEASHTQTSVHQDSVEESEDEEGVLLDQDNVSLDELEKDLIEEGLIGEGEGDTKTSAQSEGVASHKTEGLQTTQGSRWGFAGVTTLEDGSLEIQFQSGALIQLKPKGLGLEPGVPKLMNFGGNEVILTLKEQGSGFSIHLEVDGMGIFLPQRAA
jgi:dissimilatory sulfite reductase (desulfoviridin) alpha/beta subunit